MASRNEPMLDGDWLLGEEPTRQGHSLWFASVLCLMVCGAVVWTWPTLSRWYLQRHYFEQVQKAKSLDEAASGLVGLKSLLPHSAPRLVVCLNHANPDIGMLVNSLLAQHVADLESRTSMDRRASAQWLAAAIQGMAIQPTLNDRHSLSLLGARVRDLCRQDQHVTSQLAADRLDSVFGWQPDPLMPRIEKLSHYSSSDAPGIVPAVKVSLASASYGDSDSSIAPSENASAITQLSSSPKGSPIVRSLSSDTNRLDASQFHASEPQASTSAASDPLANSANDTRANENSAVAGSVVAGSVVAGKAESSTPTQGLVPIISARAKLTDSEPVTMGSVSQQGVGSMAERSLQEPQEPASAPTTYRLVSQGAEAPTQPGMMEEASPVVVPKPMIGQAQETSYSQNAGRQVEDMVPAGIEKFSDEQVISLLGSVQPSKANAAMRELERRGWNQQQLSMAIELAQGSTRQRMDAMERLVKNGQFQPIPWLTWMAQVGDREVRRHAVVLLGSIADESAQRQLRLLKNRERDSEVRDQIHRVLLSAGTGSNSQRR